MSLHDAEQAIADFSDEKVDALEPLSDFLVYCGVQGIVLAHEKKNGDPPKKLTPEEVADLLSGHAAEVFGIED